MKRLSIITLTFNEEEMINKCMDYAIKLNPYEIIIVDSGSTDNTLTILEQYTNDYPNIKWKLLERPLNGDFAGQRNEGIKLCEGDWILSLDADETLSEGFLWNKDWMMDEHGILAWAFPRIHLFPDENHFLHKSYPDTQIRFFRNMKEIRYKGKIHEIPFYNDTQLYNVRCNMSKRTTIIHWALLKTEKSLIEKGERWEEFAEASAERGFDIGKNNPRRFVFADRQGTNDEVPTDLVKKHKYIQYP